MTPPCLYPGRRFASSVLSLAALSPYISLSSHRSLSRPPPLSPLYYTMECTMLLMMVVRAKELMLALASLLHLV